MTGHRVGLSFALVGMLAVTIASLTQRDVWGVAIGVFGVVIVGAWLAMALLVDDEGRYSDDDDYRE